MSPTRLSRMGKFILIHLLQRFKTPYIGGNRYASGIVAMIDTIIEEVKNGRTS